MTRFVYIAQSLDGYIAGPNDNLDWLHNIPNPEGSDFGFADFMNQIDALVMGRKTFAVVESFGEWPYTKPVYVVSRTLKTLSPQYAGKAAVLNLPPAEIITHLAAQGHHNLYIDGGTLIQSFLAADLIDEMIITTVPILLGGGAPLFGPLSTPQSFSIQSSEILANVLIKTHYIRQP